MNDQVNGKNLDHIAKAVGMVVAAFPPLMEELNKATDTIIRLAAMIPDTKAEDRQRSRDDLKRQRREMWRRKIK